MAVLSLNAYFETLCPRIMTVIGSGGKTSLIWRLAQQWRSGKTLVTTTAKMGFPPKKAHCYDYFFNGESFQPPRSGITLAGINPEGSYKLTSLCPETLAEIVPYYDQVLIEGDGSRRLPLKAWAEYEPVVPSYTAVTVGILPLWPLGMPVSEKIIHRMELFTALTGAEQNEILTPSHLVSVIAGNRGKSLFSAAQGKKILFFNQIESEAALSDAFQLVSMLNKPFRAKLHGIIAGSVQKEEITILFTQNSG